ncbi:MAG: hypothetical protein WAO61_00775 [Solirubrobacterales bacterium]
MARFEMTVRDGPRVSRIRGDSIDELFLAVELHVELLSGRADAKPATALFREFEPIEQVVARVEISRRRGRFGRRDRAGIDVRGDGSVEAYRGRANRKLIEPWPGESAVTALRRAFDADS